MLIRIDDLQSLIFPYGFSILSGKRLTPIQGVWVADDFFYELGLFGVAPALARLCNVIADLRKDRTANILHGQPAVADYFAGFLQADRPQAEPENPVAFQIFIDSVPHPHFVEGIGVVLHDVGVGKHGIQPVKILRRHFPQNQALCLGKL